MEAGESGTRQSSYIDRYDQRNHRPPPPREAASTFDMATAALISPNTPYYPHHPTSFPSIAYPPGRTPPSTNAGMISPVESRRTSDDHDSSHRQSLPSIQEVIGKGTSGSYTPSAPSASLPPQSLPSPFASAAPARTFPTDTPGDRQPSPRGLHPAPSSSSLYNNTRPDSVSSYSNPMRPQFPGRPQPTASHPSPPPATLEAQHGIASASQSHYPPQSRPPPEQHHSQPPPQPLALQNTPYHHQPPLREPGAKHDDNVSHLGSYSHSGGENPFGAQGGPPPQLPLPPGQMPLSNPYPVSPRHPGPSSLPSPYEAHQPPPLQENPAELNRARTRYDQTVNRHFEAWSYAEYLARIGTNARTLYNFAEAFGSIAREQHSPQPIPGRMPSDREVCDMISNAEWLKTMLENLRNIVQQTVVNDRGSGSAVRPKQQGFEDDVAMYGEALNKPYTMNEVKKRRGRAAPPGRCHSCNRIDTPEWRRGPDGARTLCNACGLHYAKLERKKQLESRALRPKHPDERH